MYQARLIASLRPEPSPWIALQGLTMRLRALVDAVHEAECAPERARRPKQVEDALRSLEDDLVRHVDRLTEERLWAKAPRKASKPLPVGDIPDLIGLA